MFLLLSILVNFAYGSDVLYIGDSHSYLNSVDPSSQRLGHRLISSYRENGQSLTYYASCGSRPRHWISNGPSNMCGNTIYNSNQGLNTAPSALSRLPTLSNLIAQNNPSSVVINLGDNMFEYKIRNGLQVAVAPRSDGTTSPSRSGVIQEIKDMVALIPEGKSCVWVGPTYHTPSASTYSKSNAEVDLMYSILTEALGSRCRLVDSRSFFSSTQVNDGLHLVDSESRAWGDALVNALGIGTTAPQRALRPVARPNAPFQNLQPSVQQPPYRQVIQDAVIGGTN